MSISEPEDNGMGTILLIGMDQVTSSGLTEYLRNNYKVIVVDNADYKDGKVENILPVCAVIDWRIRYVEGMKIAQDLKEKSEKSKEAPLLIGLSVKVKIASSFFENVDNALLFWTSPFDMDYRMPFEIADIASEIKSSLENRKRKE